MPQHALPPTDGLMDLLHEVRQLTRDLQHAARQSARACGPASYRDILHALLVSRMRAADLRQRIVCYACAAELGVPVELSVESCRLAMQGGLGFGLRVLFWAAHRRMLPARAVGNWAGLVPGPRRPALDGTRPRENPRALSTVPETT